MGIKQICTSGFRTGAMAVSIVLMTCIVGCDNRQEQAVAVRERAFDIGDFQWKEFIQTLYTADFETAMAQSSDQVFLMLLYLKDMNEVFSDPTMSAFFGNGSKCFTQLYEPKLNAMLEAVVWGEQVPKIFLEVFSLLKEPEVANGANFNENYPFLASILGSLRDQIPQGRLQRLAFVVGLRQIFRDRAKKDALTLFSDYGCENPVTRAIYKNAVHFVEMEPLKGKPSLSRRPIYRAIPREET
ncbi:MAG: hypothetical protein U1F59_01260 [Candidatus Competibacteraceae bacterium]